MIRICCITYGEQDRVVKRAIEELRDEDIFVSVVEGLREAFVDEVKQKIADGVEVIIAGGANAQIARERFRCPVLDYKISDFDYVVAIEQAFQKGMHPAIVTYENGISGKLGGYLEQQKLRVKNIIYEDTEELSELIMEASVDVVLGGAHAVEVGGSLGKETVFIHSGVDSVLETIGEAKMLAREIRKTREDNQFSRTMMDYFPEGLILLDEEFGIIECNKNAMQILGLEKRYVKGKRIGEVIGAWDEEAYPLQDVSEVTGTVEVNQQKVRVTLVRIGTTPRELEGFVFMLSVLDREKKAQLDYLEKERRERKARGFQAKKEFHDIVGDSYAVKYVIEEARFFAKSDASVLLYGETGVGKEIFAQSIHNGSRRKNGPFIAVNCGALPESLLETELFGYDEGTFTGASRGGKKGLFELAGSGTIFLDEIGEISPLMQTRLLRVLQEREIMHVGGDKIIPVDVRVISATNRDLEHVESDVFRRDLLYRLNVLELRIPPLRERSGDAVVLFDYFYKQRRGTDSRYRELTEDVREIVRLYPWPGNIREMQNVCERYCLYLEQSAGSRNLSEKQCMIRAVGEERLVRAILDYYGYDGKNISSQLVHALKDTMNYNRDQVAKILDSSRTTIWRILKEQS